ncbi:helix-turn-helix domain-containing protein [Agromyces laixinhei]|uniref:helix-turn-helix domain-containing protein n=1 Tax=Agromyces laixinhei TaxID=2585717 RepID=UPI0012ED4CF6|nr:helix-turn-helix domain-containing protein [Agromyces laixinhei]
MSVESLAIALHHSRAKGSAKLVLLGIANHDGDGGAWPSVATLAHYAGIDARATQRAIGKLVDLGEIRRDVQAGGDIRVPDHRRPNRYSFLLGCPHTCDRTRNHRTRNHGLVDESLRVVETTPGVVSTGGGVVETTPKPSSKPNPDRDHPERRVVNREACSGTGYKRDHAYLETGYCLHCGSPEAVTTS